MTNILTEKEQFEEQEKRFKAYIKKQVDEGNLVKVSFDCNYSVIAPEDYCDIAEWDVQEFIREAVRGKEKDSYYKVEKIKITEEEMSKVIESEPSWYDSLCDSIWEDIDYEEKAKVKKAKEENDEEYQKYLELKEKFGKEDE